MKKPPCLLAHEGQSLAQLGGFDPGALVLHSKGLGFRVKGFRVKGFNVQGFDFNVQGFEFKVQGIGFGWLSQVTLPSLATILYAEDG